MSCLCSGGAAGGLILGGVTIETTVGNINTPLQAQLIQGPDGTTRDATGEDLEFQMADEFDNICLAWDSEFTSVVDLPNGEKGAQYQWQDGDLDCEGLYYWWFRVGVAADDNWDYFPINKSARLIVHDCIPGVP